MSLIHVRLARDSYETPWGFRLQGGKDLKQALTVQRVFTHTPSEGELHRGDVILSINGRDTNSLTHKQAQDIISRGGGQIEFLVQRPPPGQVHIQPLTPTTDTRAPTFPQTPTKAPQINIPIRRKSGPSLPRTIPVTHKKPSSPRPSPRPTQSRDDMSVGFTPKKVTLSKYGGGTLSYGSGPPQQQTYHSVVAPQPQHRPAPQRQHRPAPAPEPVYQAPPVEPHYSPPQPQQQQQRPEQYHSLPAQPEYSQPNQEGERGVDEETYGGVSERRRTFMSTQQNQPYAATDDYDYPTEPVWERRKIFFSKKTQPRGGTVDITVHQIKSDGNLKELRAASGGEWGGTQVDQKFTKFLTKLFEEDVMKNFKDNHMDDYLDIFRDFEIKKRKIALTNYDTVTLRIPSSLTELYKDMMGVTVKDGTSNSEYADTIQWKGLDKMRLDASIVKKCFNEPIKCILDHTKCLLGEATPSAFEAIVMVGGFAESPMLQECVKRENKQMKIVIPEDAGLAVLKGAVIFGHNPSAIASRVCKFTYGVATTIPFDENKHPASKKFMRNGIPFCNDVFHIHVKAGQEVKYGEAQVERIYTPTFDDQTELGFPVYASSSPYPRFVMDEGCSKLGKLSVSVPKCETLEDNKMNVRMIFGGTEIQIEAVSKITGEVTKASVDFLG